MGGAVDLTEAVGDAETIGLPPEMIAALKETKSPGFEVWAANWPVLDTFLSIDTQWRTVSMADGRLHWLGLDYSAVRDGFDMAEIKVPADIWRGVQVMERAAKAALNGYGG